MLRHRHAHLGEQGERVLQAEGHAFKDGADDVSPAVGGGQANQSGARVGVKMRRAFSHQVRGPQQAVGAGRDCCSLGGETLVRIAMVSCAGGSRAKGVAKPAQGKTRRLGHSHDVPAAGNRMAESVQPALGIQGGPVSGREDDSRGSDGRADGAGSSNSHAHRARSLITRAGHDGCARL